MDELDGMPIVMSYVFTGRIYPIAHYVAGVPGFRRRKLPERRLCCAWWNGIGMVDAFCLLLRRHVDSLDEASAVWAVD